MAILLSIVFYVIIIGLLIALIISGSICLIYQNKEQKRIYFENNRQKYILEHMVDLGLKDTQTTSDHSIIYNLPCNELGV